MQVFMVGLSFKTAEVEIRERVAFPQKRLPKALKALCAKPAIHGAVILSTCNRMEIYVNTEDADAARSQIEEFISEYHNIKRSAFSRHLYQYEAVDAVWHLFEVVCSLDSMVLGEQQIIGQIRSAFKCSLESECSSMVLSRLFRQALEVGKHVRSRTSISESHVSVSTVAIDMAVEVFPDLAERTVLLIGSGEMSELAATYLAERGVHAFIVSSRTYAHAKTLAKKLGGNPWPFGHLDELIPKADIIVSATAAPHCVITPDMLQDIQKKLLILDIALPRDVDPACGEFEGVQLVDLDDLNVRIARNQQQRQNAVVQARAIIEEEVQLFETWIDEHAVTPTIKEMRKLADQVRDQELQHLYKRIGGDLSANDQQAIEAATSAIVNKLLHEPTVRMKKSVSENSDFECVEAARYLFGLTDGRLVHSPLLMQEK